MKPLHAMWQGLPPALRFARAWNTPSAEVASRRVSLPVPDDVSGSPAPVPGTVVAPAGSRGTRGWVVLHGLTRKGSDHTELVRFTNALASTGARVVVPEIREWVDLRFAPERANTVIRAAVEWMDEHPDTLDGGVILVGFSFGGPQALLAAAAPELERKLRGVVSWGGYAELERVVRFSFTGEHEWQGRTDHIPPDPYVRWIIGGNCLPLRSEEAMDRRVADALLRLAREAGDRGVRSADPVYDPVKRELRETLPTDDRALFDLFAPPTDREPDREAAGRLMVELVPVIRRRIPMLDPVPLIESIPSPVRLLHGRADDLIPFTETLRLEEALGSRVADLQTRITGLFSHSGEDGNAGITARTREGLRFLAALRGIFELA